MHQHRELAVRINANFDETNTCLNLDPPVEVLIDPDGEFTVLVHDREDA